MCVFVSSCQATKVLISKYLATRKAVVSVGGVNGSERQLLTSLIHAPNWGPLDHASGGPNYGACIIYLHV